MLRSTPAIASLLSLCAACGSQVGDPAVAGSDPTLGAPTVQLPEGLREVELELEGGGDFPEVQMGIRRRFGLSACFDVARQLDPALAGDVVFTFTFAPDGSPPEVAPTGGSLAGTHAAADCAASLAQLDVAARPTIARYTLSISPKPRIDPPAPEALARVRTRDLDVVALEGPPPSVDAAALTIELARCLTWNAADVWALATYDEGKILIARARSDGDGSAMERECVQAKLARIAPASLPGRGLLSFAARSTDSGPGAAPPPAATPPPAAPKAAGEPRRTPPPDPRKVAQLEGRLHPEVIQQVVRSHFGDFRRCYERVLAADPKATGRVVTVLTIERDGKVSQARATSSDLPDKELIACVEKVFKALTFPTNQSAQVKVTYPIHFSPDDGTATPPKKKADALRDLLSSSTSMKMLAARIDARVPPTDLLRPDQLLVLARQEDGGVAVIRRVPRAEAGACSRIEGDVALDVQTPPQECARLLDAALPRP